MKIAQTTLRLLTAILALSVPATSTHALNIAETPLFLTGSVQPLVMLDISKDRQLYKKAYNDYSDLDGDGQLETTYKHSMAFSYYGYFDPTKCYTYSSGNNRFEPTALADSNKYCNGTTWSGNFLNWATMSRMDAVRKLLYGGKRSTDTSSNTVLERAYLPTDAHSWAKYYNGSDINQLTPFTPPATPTAINNSNAANTAGIGTGLRKFRVGSAGINTFSVGDQVVIRDHANPNNYMVGAVSCVKGVGVNMYNGIASNAHDCNSGANEIGVVVERTGGTTGGTNQNWDIYNHTQTGITICNTTLGGTGDNGVSQTNTNPPLMRVAQGNFGLWAANERWQCMWRDEVSFSGLSGENTGSLGGTRTNGNRVAITGLYASSIGPNKTTASLGRVANALGAGDYNVRVQACVSNLLGGEKCKRYPNGNYKPIGLLHVYGDTNQIHFGLMTGSYNKNISGGVLRKNVGPFTNEVNVNSDGTFTAIVTDTGTVSPSIVGTLDRMRLYGYSYADGGIYNNNDSCAWQLTNITEGNCSTWGNPMAELYFESLRYFAGKAATSAYTYSGSSKDSTLKLPLATWSDPLKDPITGLSPNYCAPLNTLVFNASVSTNDFDLASTTMADINKAGSTAATLANLVGTGEGIAGGSYFIGANGSDNNELCSDKTIGNLGSVYGICPEGPTLLGSYLMPGMAYAARTNKIRTDLTIPATDTKSLKVATYGIQLATNVPQVRIALQGETNPRVIIQPAYRLFNYPATQGGGALVDMQIVSQTATTRTASGLIYLNWEDSEQGGDYDQDMWGILSYCLTLDDNGCGTGTVANRVYVTTRTLAESTVSPQGFGYTISGTTQDGPHFHSGIEGFNFTDPRNITLAGGSNNASGGCNNCQVSNTASTATYTLSGSTAAGVLKDPLYYAAKWGGFNDLNNDGTPNATNEWDVLTTSGTPGSDGIPDNYFLVSNPLGLEIALNSAFLKILKDSSASAVATDSSTLNTGSRVYQGRFSNSFWSGQLLSYRLNETTGAVLSAATPPPAWDPAETPYPEWDSGQKIKALANATPNADTRLILTRNSTSKVGVEFAWNNLSTGTGSQQSALNLDRLLQQDNCGLERVGFLRGHSANEGDGALTCATAPASGVNPQKFRTRDVSILGDIINSNPAFVGPPSAGYSDVDHQGYSAFRNSFKDRTPVVYVGANDGMLHGFNVSVDTATNLPTTDAGKEVLAYVPTSVYGNLSWLTDSEYKSTHKYFVDGSPMMADACISTTDICSANWKTVLVGGLGAGGKGFYALNITNPLDSTKNTTATPLFNVANAANIVMWEFTSSDDADMGLSYNLSPIKLNNGQSKQIVKFENGRWGVILGNGYNSTSGNAVLYVLFLSGPTGSSNTVWQGAGVDFMKIEAHAGANNGLSTPIPFDADGDGLVDSAYAGDLLGNMWKFDLSSATPASWTVAFSGAPLFAAGASQPITTPPEVTLHSTSGVMVLFGTGKYLETTDSTSNSTQAFYAIRDSGAAATLAELTPQTITTTSISGTTFRTTSQGCDADPGTLLPDCPATSKGWYANLPTSGERHTGSPKALASTIIFNTFIPSISPCQFGGTGWLMALDYLTGATRSVPTFDTNASGTVTGDDTPVAGIQVGAALGGTTLIKSGYGANAGVVGISSTTEGKLVPTPPIPTPGNVGRINWREIIE